MKVKEESEKPDLKLNIQKIKIKKIKQHSKTEDHDIQEKCELSDIIFLCSKIAADSDCSHEVKRRLLLGRRAMTNLAY